MKLISPRKHDIGVYGGYSQLLNAKQAAKNQIWLDKCTSR